MGPLDGVRIVDLTHVLNGPFATMLLAHMGAEVIKIETREGDRFRYAWMPVDADHSGYEYLAVNANKKTITLNLKDERGKELLRSLVKTADVVVENFSRGVMDRLGLGYEALHAINERLIYASSTGYGDSGPYRDMRANAGIVNGASGWTARGWHEAGVEGKHALGIGDEAAGMSMALGICGALFAREKTGVGQKIHVAMVEAVLGFMVSTFHTHFEGIEVGSKPKRCLDGYVTFHLPQIPDPLWRRFVTAMGHPEAADDPRFTTGRLRQVNYVAMEATIAEWVGSLTRAQLWSVFRECNISGGPIRALDELFTDEHWVERQTFVKVDHAEAGELTMLAPWIHFSETPGEIVHAGSGIGEHNREVYCGLLGLDAAVLEEYQSAGVI
jgi:crotonobetainyl-CoA:carnitine CoA-transferase CaiB-like acyl-CoA transferase